jgi:pimeloyl-ACP methyl ester carboxylesterase
MSRRERQRETTLRETDGADSASRGWLAAALGGAAALGAAALYTRKAIRDAERAHPPLGRFLTVGGVRLHFVERGQGEPLLLIHGNGSLIQDFLISGLVERLSDRYRVIMIERPGFGYSMRPRRFWTPQAQARLFHEALNRLGVERAHVLGHSWGALVALSLAVDFPDMVQSLVLEGGYYFPTTRADALLLAPPAIPVVGDAMRYTVAPLAGRLILPGLIEKIFEPAPVTDRFQRLFPKRLVLRPSHLRASAEDIALMIPAAAELQHRYSEIEAPLVIVTGAGDRIVHPVRQAVRLHRAMPGSELMWLPDVGHMAHHTAPDMMVEAIDRAAHRAARSHPRSDSAAEVGWP